MNIKNDLENLADGKYKKFQSGLCPETENILGIRVPVLRNYAKELCKNFSTQDLLNNIEDDFYEEIMLQGMIIGFDKSVDWQEKRKCIEEFVPKIDNWAVCDVFCAGLKFTKKYKKEMWTLINEYTKSDEEFELRFAIVMILDYYIEEEYVKKIFEIFNQIKSEKYYVKMAIAWAISICLIKYYEETMEFLKNKSELDAWTYNKAIQKAIESYRITDEHKKELRSMKK